MTPNADSAPDPLAAAGAPMADIAPLAWVIDEIRSSLTDAVTAVKGFLGNKSDIDCLRTAGEHVHQVSGALQLLDLRGITLVTEAVEQLIQRWESEPGLCLPAAVRAVDATLGAVRNYLDGLLAGRSAPPVRLFPYYRDILLLLNAQRVHPADLIFPDLNRRPAFDRMEVRSLSADELRIRRVMYEEGLLRFLRNPDDAQARGRMRDAIAQLEGLPQRGLARSFWWVTHALFDALESFQLPVDADLKRFLARLNQQLRRQIEGGPAVAERLMIDALYHVGLADERIERVAQVKQLFGLASLLPSDFERPTLNAMDAQTVTALREALNQCKLLWGQVVASNPPDPARFRAEVARAQASAQQLGAAAAARVLGCIAETTAGLATTPPSVREDLGMEVATALLLIESGADGNPAADPLFAQRADAMITRIVSAAGGQPLAASDAWIAQLAQRAQERSSMETVVTEMRTMLRESELRLDRFFRNPAQRGELADLAPMFEEVSGVLAVLGFEDPAAALRNVRAAVERFTDPAVPANPEQFAQIAQNLGAVGFFVAGLTEQPTQPRGMFSFDQGSGVFSADMALPPPVPTVPEEPAGAAEYAAAYAANIAQGGPTPAAPAALAHDSENVEHSIERLLTSALAAADELVAAGAKSANKAALDQLGNILAQLTNDAEVTDDAALRTRVAEAGRLLSDLRGGAGAGVAQALQALLRPAEAAIPAPTAPMPTSASAADRELHEIFVEEADEVLESVSAQLAHLKREPEDAATITMARRAFHTLKGSSRMVGLRDFGEFAWALEQCFNVWLAQERPANADLLGLASASADRMRDWIEALRTDPAAQVDASAFIHAAHVVRDGGAFSLPYTLAQDEIADPKNLTIEVAAAPPPAEDGAGDAQRAPGDGTHASTDSPADSGADAEEDARRIGPLVISHGLYSVFLTESDECVRALSQDIGEWRYESAHEVSEPLVRRAHTLAGIADTVGLAPVCAIADPLDALMQQLFERRGSGGATLSGPQFDILERGLERMRGMLHQFAAGIYPDEAPLEAGALRDLVAVLRALPGERAAAAPFAFPDLPPQPPEPPPAVDGPFPDTVPLAWSERDALDFGMHPAAPRTPASGPVVPAAARGAAPPPAGAATPAPAPVPAPVVPRPAPPPAVSAPLPAPAAAPAVAPARTAPVKAAPAVASTAASTAAPTAAPTPAPIWASIATPPAPPAPAPAAPLSAGLVAGPAAAVAVEPPADAALDAALDPAALPTVRDDIDPQLLQIFTVEAQDLLPAIARCLRTLAQNPGQRDVARDMMRHLHTFKGSARMAGAMKLGELVHDMETRIEAAMQLASVPGVVIEDLQSQYDQAQVLFDRLLHNPSGTPEGAAGAVGANLAATLGAVSGGRASAAPPPVRAWEKEPAADAPAEAARAAVRDGEPARLTSATAPFIRVRADLIDRLVDHAGEVSISRSKLEAEVATLRGSLTDLTENIQRLRSQLREVELQADAQIQARSDQVAKQSSSFDPLEFDRYSRLQELTRLLAESVEDVALVQSNMIKGLQLADNDLGAQSRLTRELQQQLMRVRLVPFSNVSERLYRVARQAAKELQKRAHLDIVGAETEIDRSLLEQMAGPFEHLVRNAIVHGLELPADRMGAGKSDTGELRIEVRREGNEIVVVFADDGAGLDLERIRARAISTGLLSADRKLEERELIDFIFTPGLSTAREVTELAGRGVGMDVVREQVASLGGRIAVTTQKGAGTRFTLYLPMTLSIMQVVLASVGNRRYALPAAMVEEARRVRSRELVAALQSGSIAFGDLGEITLRPLSQLLGVETVISASEQHAVALLRLGDDRLAICADELSANQEVVVKNVGPQVARLAGVLGATVMGNGEVVLIINPVQLIGRAPEPPVLGDQEELAAAGQAATGAAAVVAPGGATVMVVDDSLTVRRVTQRLLERNGYRTVLAKDGVDAMRELQEHLPDIMLVDIEMPRMDGYDLTRNVRGNPATRAIPIIMITSRTAEKHRRVAFELGVNEYLGKPYREDELLELVHRYVETARAVRAANESA
jgi:chemosensory pili system protein ChpA (sensor histidine kinase/response regulator)